MNQKFFNVFPYLAAANNWIAANINLIKEVNSEVFDDGQVIVKYRSEVGRLS